MIKIMFLAVAAVLCIAILAMNSSITSEEGTTIIESEEIFHLNYDNLHKGKKITWDWEVEKGLSEPKPKLFFWIEDSEGNIYYEIESSKDKGSFTVPLTDNCSIKWENPYLEESDHSTLKLAYIVEIVNQLPIASINEDKTSGPASLNVSFTGAGVDYDGEIKSYSWNFGDGHTSNLKNPTHTFPNTGTYTITLTVTDDNGAIGKDMVEITVDSLV